MIVCIFEYVQWRRALNDRLAPGYLNRDQGRRPHLEVAIDRRQRLPARDNSCPQTAAFAAEDGVRAREVRRVQQRRDLRQRDAVGQQLEEGRLGAAGARAREARDHRRLGLYPIVTLQYSSTTSYQVSYHIQYLFF